MNKKAIATASTLAKSSENKQEARLDAVRTALTEYFLGSAATTERFWETNNPSLGDKSPANLAKTGKLKNVEQYVNYLRKHARFARAKFVDKPTYESFLVFEGTEKEVLEKLKESPAGNRIVAILFQNAESYYTYAPLYRQILGRLPEIAWRQHRREHQLYSRFLFALTADLPVAPAKRKVTTRLAQRKRPQS